MTIKIPPSALFFIREKVDCSGENSLIRVF